MKIMFNNSSSASFSGELWSGAVGSVMRNSMVAKSFRVERVFIFCCIDSCNSASSFRYSSCNCCCPSIVHRPHSISVESEKL